jgi:hypothetical protein
MAVALVIRLPLSLSVQICDTTPPPTLRNPSNHVPVDNKDCVITSQSFIIHDRTCFRKLQRETCMLMIERRGEHYLVHFLQTDNRFSAFALPSQRFPDMQSLIGFLRQVLHIPQQLVDEALRTGSLRLSPEQIERWRA